MSGELGLEEHVPISPMPAQSAAYGGRAYQSDDEVDDECDQDVNDIDEMYVLPPQTYDRSQMETEQDLEGQMDGIEDDEQAESPGQ